METGKNGQAGCDETALTSKQGLRHSPTDLPQCTTSASGAGGLHYDSDSIAPTLEGGIKAQGTLTCLLVISDQEFKDAVHGPHVEDEPQLCDTHGDQAEQHDGAEHTVHERGGCCGKKAWGSGPENMAHPASRAW